MTKSIFKNIFLTLSFMICCGLWLTAQPNGEERKMGQGGGVGQVEKMAQELGLNDEQKKQMQAINQEMAQKRRETGKNLTPEDRKAAMDKIKAEHDTKIKAILTAEQQTKFTEIQENRPRVNRERQEVKPEKLAEKLGLDEAQNAEFKKITDETKAKMKEIRSSTVSPEEKKAALKQLEEAQEEKLKTVLNNEQYEKYLTEKGETKERIQEKMKAKKKMKKEKKKKKAKKAKKEKKAKKQATTTEEVK